MIVSELESLFSLKIDGKSFEKADNAVQKLAGKASTVFKGLAGAFAVGAVANFVNGLVQAGSALEDVSKRIGITTNALQELQFAAGQDGVDAGQLENALRRLAGSASDAAEGGKEAAALFRELGVDVRGANGEIKGAEQLLAEAADGFAKIENPIQRAALAQKVFGRGGQVLIPFLSKGAAGLEEMRKRFQELGGGFSEDFVKNADEVGDKLDEVRVATDSLKSRIGEVLLPIVSWAVTKFTDFLIAIQRVLKGTDYLKYAFYALATAAIAAGAYAIAPWVPMIALFLGIGAAVLFVIGLFEDIFGLFEGKKTLIGEFIDEWLGLGTASNYVNNFKIGIDSLSSSMVKLWHFANDVIELFGRMTGGLVGKLFGFDTDENDKQIGKISKRMADFEREVFGDIGAAAKGWWAGVNGVVDENEVTAGRGVHAQPQLDPSIARSASQNVNSQLAKGSPAFGQVARGATQGGMGDSVNQSVSVTVNANTNASPQDIARTAREEVNKALSHQNKNLRGALGGRTSR